MSAKGRLQLFSTAAVLLCVGCSDAHVEQGRQMEVELDAFSGRPNPKWVIPPERAIALAKALSSLPGAPPIQTPDQLGYRGFIIRYEGFEARVHGGRVVVTRQGATRSFFDSQHVEEELTRDARRLGLADSVPRFEQ